MTMIRCTICEKDNDMQITAFDHAYPICVHCMQKMDLILLDFTDCVVCNWPNMNTDSNICKHCQREYSQ